MGKVTFELRSGGDKSGIGSQRRTLLPEETVRRKALMWKQVWFISEGKEVNINEKSEKRAIVTSQGAHW